MIQLSYRKFEVFYFSFSPKIMKGRDVLRIGALVTMMYGATAGAETKDIRVSVWNSQDEIIEQMRADVEGVGSFWLTGSGELLVDGSGNEVRRHNVPDTRYSLGGYEESTTYDNGTVSNVEYLTVNTHMNCSDGQTISDTRTLVGG